MQKKIEFLDDLVAVSGHLRLGIANCCCQTARH